MDSETKALLDEIGVIIGDEANDICNGLLGLDGKDKEWYKRSYQNTTGYYLDVGNWVAYDFTSTNYSRAEPLVKEFDSEQDCIEWILKTGE